MIEKKANELLRFVVKIKNKTNIDGTALMEYFIRDKDTNYIYIKSSELRDFSGGELIEFIRDFQVNYLGGKDIIPSFKFKVGSFVIEKDFADFFTIIQTGYRLLVNKIILPTYSKYKLLSNKTILPTYSKYKLLSNKTILPTYSKYKLLSNKTILPTYSKYKLLVNKEV